MKKKISSYNNVILSSITKTEKFKIIIILSILLSIYGSTVLTAGINNYFNSIMNTFQFGTFNALFFSLLFMNTLNVCITFDKYDSYIIRLKTKKVYLKNLIKLVTLTNIIVIAVVIFTYLVGLNLLKFYYISIEQYNGYINNFIYSIFYLIRYVIISLLFSIINTLIYHKFGEKKTIIVDLMFISCFWTLSYYDDAVTNSFKFLPWEYFQNIRYGSFMLEVNYSILYILLLELIIFMVYKIVNTRMNKSIKYTIFNDLEYLIRHKKNLLLLLIALPITVLLIVGLKFNMSGVDIFIYILGLDLVKNKITIIGLVIFIFNISIYLFLAMFLYIKDLKSILDNIFLREKIEKWYIVKSSFIILLACILKSIQYLLIGAIIYLFREDNIIQKSFMVLFISDFLFTIASQQLFILSYLFYSLFRKTRLILLSIIGILILVIPKSIVIYNDFNLLLLIVNVILYIIVLFIFKSNKRNIIQNIGGI